MNLYSRLYLRLSRSAFARSPLGEGEIAAYVSALQMLPCYLRDKLAAATKVSRLRCGRAWNVGDNPARGPSDRN